MIPIFIIITLSYSIISIYAFYISFKSQDENFRLFWSLLKENLWKVLKVSLIAFARIMIGTLLFVIPGMVLTLRYAAINYFVILENADFTTAREKSTEVMRGFKFYSLLFIVSMSLISELFEIYIKHLAASYGNEILYLVASILFEGLYITLYSIIIYTICKHEAYKDVAVADVPQAAPNPEAIDSDPTIVAMTPTTVQMDLAPADIAPVVDLPTAGEAIPSETKEVEAPLADKPESPS